MNPILDPAVYRAAADQLREDGWTKKTMQNLKGECCLVGALRKKTALWEVYVHGLAELLGYDGQPGQSARGVTITWNDDLDRTIDEVLDLLEQAAEKVEANR